MSHFYNDTLQTNKKESKANKEIKIDEATRNLNLLQIKIDTITIVNKLESLDED